MEHIYSMGVVFKANWGNFLENSVIMCVSEQKIRPDLYKHTVLSMGSSIYQCKASEDLDSEPVIPLSW